MMEHRKDRRRPLTGSDKQKPTVESDYEDEDASAALDAKLAPEEAWKQNQKARRLEETAERMKCTEEAIQSLEELCSQYRADPLGTSKLCIGDCITEIHRRRQSLLSLQIPRLSAAICAIMQLLLDKIPHGDSKLNEVDNEGQAPLSIATRYGILDCIELLVSKGADLSLQTPAKVSPKIIESYCAGKTTGISLDNSIIGLEHAGEIEQYPTMWIHVPITSISTLLAVARKIDEKRNEKEFNYSEYAFTRFMSSSFLTPTIVPSNPLLSYQDIIYDSSVVRSSGFRKDYEETTVIVGEFSAKDVCMDV
ncbi:hypothetical protein HBH89_126360 [Parastagonospora nodorum]|nr:hypothetical protein HBH43_179500 [Parastagonospora nodorum]KAH4426823.1 hypothetical protein HBH93_169900 [Parastagonospora nodorum]KAH4499546.1 hypothetical protein HBH89_126360 [Parastagonospora nodorum]KAH4548598.1 hypothetical protein HBH86_128910 [Parastagonospora nodorum]KAH4869606.1 hypothetical protein HBH59_134360 [Parastagonospora nodorum]